MEVLDRGIPREGCTCFKDDHEVGFVTSGSISPVRGIGIALGYVDVSFKEGDGLYIRVRDKLLQARIKRPPFVNGTLKT